MGIFEKHMAAIQSGKIEKTNVIGLRKALTAFEKHALRISLDRAAPTLQTWQVGALETALNKYHPVVVGELHNSGVKVLQNPRYKKRWTVGQRFIIDTLKRFELVRFDFVGRNGYQAVPVYKVVGGIEHEDHFYFRNIPWQTAWTLGEDDGPRVVEGN